MATLFQHPTDAVLAAYLQGRLSPKEAEQLDAHIERCDACCQKLSNVGNDSYCELLQETVVLAPRSAPNLELPSELHGHPRYQIQHQLGHGGMGVVYLARHRMMNRLVALKLIRRELLASPEAVDRFRREVRAAARLAHPNIVTAYDAEEVGGVHFLAMEYVNGKTLDAIVRKRGPLPIPVACHLARQVAMGLDHAHSRSMIHRDIKPQNLILADKTTVKILDFGLARWHADEPILDSSTREGIMLGTMDYAAPEQRRSAAEVDARADLYSLGATLGYLLTGELPCEPHKWPDTIPSRLREVLSRLLAPVPEDRYASAKEVVEALSPWCSRRALRMETPQPRNRRWIYLAVGLFALLTVIGIWAMTRPPRPVGPAAVPTKSEPQWISLLRFDPAPRAIAGEWRMIRGELQVNAETGARIAIPSPVPAEYDLRCEFTRETGDNSVGMIVVQNGRQVVFELDTWYQHLGGFQDIAGQSIVNNPTRRENVQLVNGRRYTMLVEVRRDSIRGLLDGEVIATHRTDGRDLSINPQAWAMPNHTGLGLVAWNSATTFHRLEIASR